MDFELGEEYKMVANTVRDFMVAEIEPIAMRIDKEAKLPGWILKKLGDMGLMGITIPEEYGGGGLDYLADIIAIKEMTKISPSLGLTYGVHTSMAVENIYRNATEEQRRKFLPQLCNGEKIGALALTEPNHGSDAVGMEMKAKREGNYYILNGEKMFITNAPIADTFLLYAKTAPELGSKGITAFIVERGYEGKLEITELDKMGYRGSPTGQMFFEDYRVPKENVLGEENKGVRVMMNGLDTERTVMSAICLGLAESALEMSIKYSKERKQFGKPICSYQMIQEKLANMYTLTEACRLMIYKAADLAQKSERGGRGTELHKMAAATLLFTAESSSKVVQDAMQIFGGYSYMLDCPVNRLFRATKLNEIGGGTSEMRRLIIARELLGDYQ
ncbi:MAG: isovaleryl-CoA dehydrogenase [candidate division Zixibacteria bacterium RBG_16_53_22]|nr:MAG: isovaleryl-CoA dehydrogenase [candidate division Zixibacteria bacterium RBG_16_53_22]